MDSKDEENTEFAMSFEQFSSNRIVDCTKQSKIHSYDVDVDEDEHYTVEEVPSPGKYSNQIDQKLSHFTIVKKNEIETLKRQIAIITENNQMFKAKTQKQKIKLNSQKEIIMTLRVECETKSAELAEIKAIVSTQNKDLGLKQSETQKQKIKLNSQKEIITALRVECETKNAELAEIRATISTLNEEIALKQSENQHLQEQLRYVKEIVSQLNQSCEKMAESITNKIQQVSLTSRDEINEAQERVSQLEDLLVHSKEVKEADNQKINELSKLEHELKVKNIALQNKHVEKTKLMQELSQKVNSLSEPMLPMTITKEDISQSSKHGSEFDEHLDFIKQTIVSVLASSSNMRNNATKKLLSSIKKQMNNNKVSLVTVEIERGTNTYNFNGNSCLQLDVRGLKFIFFTPPRN